MATYNTDLNLFDAADSAGNWSELSGHTSGAAPSADTENYMQNSISVSQATGQASTTAAGMECDYGSAITWTAGWVIVAWQYYTAPTNINTWANGGMRIGVGSSSGNMYYWNAMGDDFGGSPYACWQNTAIDPSDPSGTTYSNLASDTSDGSPTGAVRIFGSLPNVRAKISKGSPHACDIIRYGRGEIYATGTGGTFAGYAGANDADTARWGLFQKTRGGYLWKGLFSFGQSGTSLTFSDSNANIFVDDTPRVRPTFNKIQILNSSTSVTWTGVNIVGVQTSITGSAPVSPGDFDNTDSGTIAFTSCNFTDMGTWTFNAATNSNDVLSCVFLRCKLITASGCDLTGSSVLDSTVAADASALLWNSSTNPDGYLDNMTFSEGANAHHAIEFGSSCPASMTIRGLDVGSDFASTNGQNNSTFYISDSNTGNSYTINCVGCTGNMTYKSAGAGVTIVSDPVTVKVTCVNTAGAPLQNIRVFVKAKDATGPFPFEEAITSISNSGTTATVNHTGHGMATNDYVFIYGTDIAANEGVFQITVTSVDQYTYTMASTPGSSPTVYGTATFVALFGLSDSSGVVSTSRVYSSDQPITGWARNTKITHNVDYQQGVITGSVDSVDGLTGTAVLVLDS